METGLNAFKEALHLKHVEAGEYSPLALAYIGDAVYELAIRTLVMNRGNMQVNKMHKKTANLVKADAQARLYLLLEEELTDAEKAAYLQALDGSPKILFHGEERDDEGLPDGDRI